MNTKSGLKSNPLEPIQSMLVILVFFSFFCLSFGSTATSAREGGTKNLPILEKTNGAGIPSATDPLNAAYLIEGKEIRLQNGRFETEAAPGSATRIKTAVFADPVYGDMDGDGDADAVLLLTQDPGGSGTFYYIAVAINRIGGYRGTRAVRIGDRIAPQDTTVRNGLIVTNYADRRPDEPMAALPSVAKSRYLILKNTELEEIKLTGNGEQILEGWVTIGHEGRNFLPCGVKGPLWLLGNSPALDTLLAAYREKATRPKPYTPLFMILVGTFADPPADGFGSQYEAAFFTTQLVRVWPKGNCKSDWIYLETPLPGAMIDSPLTIQGHARGNWFFEGDFPVVLTDAKGAVIAERFATAKGDWMTETFVRFEGIIEFKKPKTGDSGTLILKKDNPTGLPKHDDALEIPVFFR